MRIASILVLLAACRGEPSANTPIVVIRNMVDQPRYDPQSAGPLFADGRAMRPLVDGVVPREAEADVTLETGRLADDTGWLLKIPEAVIDHAGGMQPLAERGRDRYEIYCAPCHASVGNGQGIMVQRGMNPPPTFHSDLLRTMPDGQIFATISNGIRVMPPYGYALVPTDRWAVVAYVRALQLSQNAGPAAAGIPGGAANAR